MLNSPSYNGRTSLVTPPLGGVVHAPVVFVIELLVVSSGVSLVMIPPAME